MNERLRRGALLEPSRDNALVHFRAAEAAGPGDMAVRNARDSLVAALLNASDAEINADRAPAARRLLDAAASINSGAPGLDPLRRRLEEMGTKAPPAVVAAPVEPVAAPARDPEPATVAAAAPPPEVVQESVLRRLQSVDPEYPGARAEPAHLGLGRSRIHGGRERECARHHSHGIGAAQHLQRRGDRCAATLALCPCPSQWRSCVTARTGPDTVYCT